MGVRFEATECILALALHIMDALKKMQREFMDQAKSKMLSPEARSELSEGDYKLLAGAIAIEIIGGPWVAMDEYGTGSLLDQSNPALAEYVSSDKFNPLRRIAMPATGYAKLGRAKGTYRDIFGRNMHSSGRLSGANLEKLAERGVIPDRFGPTPPSKALQEAAGWLVQEGRVANILQDIVARFPWGQFFVVTKDH